MSPLQFNQNLPTFKAKISSKVFTIPSQPAKSENKGRRQGPYQDIKKMKPFSYLIDTFNFQSFTIHTHMKIIS